MEGKQAARGVYIVVIGVGFCDGGVVGLVSCYTTICGVATVKMVTTTTVGCVVDRGDEEEPAGEGGGGGVIRAPSSVKAFFFTS